jgi:hypothetical protein
VPCNKEERMISSLLGLLEVRIFEILSTLSLELYIIKKKKQKKKRRRTRRTRRRRRF